MKKTFTMNIPNELYVDNFSENKTAEYEYDGPETFLVEIEGPGSLVIVEEPRAVYDENVIKYVEVDANENIEVAYFLQSRPIIVEHEIEEQVNEYDGSIYLCVTNPRIQDYYTLQYVSGEWKFELITKSLSSTIELQVAAERDKIVSKLGAIALPDDIEAAYIKYNSDVDAWLAEKEPLQPWKFVEFPAGDVPKVPFVLIKVMNELASYGAN